MIILVRKVIRIFSHLGAVAVVFLIFFPAVAYFLFSSRLIGVDTAHFLYYVIEFSHRLPFPAAGWKMTWFEGTPQMLDYPWLNFYLIQPLVRFFGALSATRIYLIGQHFIFVLFSYLVFFELSGSILLSLALAAGVSRSFTTYIQLYSAGATLSSIAQVAFPAALYFLLRFTKTKSKKMMGLAIIAVAFGFYSHDLTAGFFAFIPALVFIFFYSLPKEKFLSKEKIKRLLFFAVGTLFLSFPPVMVHVVDFFTGIGIREHLIGALGLTSTVGFDDLFKSTNLVFFIFFPIALISTFFFDLKQRIRLILPLGAILLYFLLFQLSYTLGINPAIGVIFPHRSFWLFPLLIGALISIFLFVGKSVKFRLIKQLVDIVKSLLILAGTLYWGSQSLDPNLKGLDYLEHGIGNITTYRFSNYKINNLFAREKPGPYQAFIDFFGNQDSNHRLYVYDSSVRIGWNMFSVIPQTYGYYHYYTQETVDWLAWLYASFSRENYDEGGIPEDIARQQALFLADWYAVRYIATFIPLLNNVAPHFYEDNPYVSAKTNFGPPALIKLSPEYVSEIARPSKAPVLGFVGDKRSYDYFMRNLGILNLNSNYLIPIRLAHFVEDLTPERLEGIDGLVFYNYYRKKEDSKVYQAAWKRLGGFLQDGGVILIETGAECPEKWGEKIPEIFPISQLDSGSLGAAWNITSDFFSKSDFENLSPLTYEGGNWTVSFVPSENLIKPGARILLKQKGKPVIVEKQIGGGKVIWSGLNLFYRPLHHQETALAETRLLEKLLAELAPLEQQEINFDFNRPEPEKVILEFTGGHGALLKENNYGGWIAQATVDGKKIGLPILMAGPYFMYAPLPRELWDKSIKLEFVYRGLWHYWLFFIIAIITFFFLLDLIILNQRIFNLFYLPLKNRIVGLRKQAKERWDEEEV